VTTATTGGSIVARCSAGDVTLLSWSPAQGYRTDDVEPGPATAATVKFKADRTEVWVTVTCVAGEPTAASSVDNGH
jgi:hypothetical protein